MSDPDSIELEFEVGCSPEHAFDVFAEKTASWWPDAHTRSGDPEAVTIEPRIGGRIFERAASGEEHDWGEVVAWEPPRLLRYLWHIYGPRERATEVEIRFEGDRDRTMVRVVQTGFSRLDVEAESLRERNYAGWSSLFEHFAVACVVEIDPSGRR